MSGVTLWAGDILRAAQLLRRSADMFDRQADESKCMSQMLDLKSHADMCRFYADDLERPFLALRVIATGYVTQAEEVAA